MKRFIVIMMFSIGLLIDGVQAGATTIYSTFGPGHTYDSSHGWIIGGTYELNGTGYQIVASPFVTPAIDTTLETIDFAAGGGYFGTTHQLTVQLVADSSGQPTGAVVESFDFTNTLVAYPNSNVYEAVSVVRPTLLASTQYWVELTVSNIADSSDWWYWNDRGLLGTYFKATYTNNTWTYGGTDPIPAFDVNATAAVPEPSLMVLLGISMASIVGLRRWWKD